MSMQKDIIERIRKEGGDFLIELKANQRSLRHGVEDRLSEQTPLYSYTEGHELGHGRIETRTYSISDDLEIIADKEKWCGGMTVVEYESDAVRKSTSVHTTEKKAVCDEPAHGYSQAGFHSAQPLAYRKHALGTGRQDATGQGQT